MKKLILTLLIPLSAFSQWKTTASNGNFYNPATWTCFCLPANGDSLVINHAVVMDIDIYYTSGQIKINASGSLTQGGVDRAVWSDGGSIVNAGTFESHHYLVSNGGYLMNSGSFTTDSLLNQSTINNSGNIYAYDLANDEMATFTNSNGITVSHDMNNQGMFTNAPTGLIQVTHDFSNCNTQTLDAFFSNNGGMCIGNDFGNCAGDTLSGSGDYYVGNLSGNLGVFNGTFTFYTPTGSLTVGGQVDPGVTVAMGTCNLTLNESEKENLAVYPNPTNSLLSVPLGDVDFVIYDPMGKVVLRGTVMNQTIDVSTLVAGSYLLQFDGMSPIRINKN